MACFIRVTLPPVHGGSIDLCGNVSAPVPARGLLVNMDLITSISTAADGSAVLWRGGSEIHVMETTAEVSVMIKEAGR